MINLVCIVSVLAVGFSGCLWSGEEDDASTIVLYGFSVKGEVFDRKIIPAFTAYWKDLTGDEIEFHTSYAGSGKITNQVITGAPAEVMILSTEWDALELRKNGMVTTDWREFPENGTVSTSPWVIMTRTGNPKGILGFENLTREGIEIIHADPTTSGGACWSIFSVYGSALILSRLEEGEPNETAAREMLSGVMENVISWQSSARKALSQFTLGYGDVLITYENDAILSRLEGNEYEIIYPSSTIFSEHKVVMVDANIDPEEESMIGAFVQFLYTPEVQGYLADFGFRSVDEMINKEHEEFPGIEYPFTVAYLGGWETAHAEIIEGMYHEIRNS